MVATAVVIVAEDVVNVARVGRESAHKQESASREASGLRVVRESDHHGRQESDRHGHRESVCREGSAGKESEHKVASVGKEESEHKAARGQHVHHAHRESAQRAQGELDVLLNRLQRLQRRRLFLKTRRRRFKMFRRLR